MMKNKRDIQQFLVWMRNGIAFCTTWFLMLWLVYNYVYGIKSISTENLIELLLFVTGGVFIFSLSFTRFFLKKWSFLKRLTCFMVLISIYECVVFYSAGWWQGSGTLGVWLGFVGIILCFYLLCIAIYHIYSKKQGELYTQALQDYQKKRSLEYGN